MKGYRGHSILLATLIMLMVCICGCGERDSGSDAAAKPAPRCAGLKCNDNGDCGTKCRCDNPGGGLGVCVAKGE